MTTRDLHPQAVPMGSDAMVRNLGAQADVLWPLEAPLFERYGLGPEARILDLGCGTGEITARLAEARPESHLLGIDLHAPHLDLARRRCAGFGGRVAFAEGDAMALDLPDATFDLVVCRHLVQAVPRAETVLEECVRVLRPGGWLHVLAEDYATIFVHPTQRDNRRFWMECVLSYGEAVGTDLCIGRKLGSMLTRLGVEDARVDVLCADTLRAGGAAFARILEAWRDAYTDELATHTDWSRDEVDGHWDDMLSTLARPDGHAMWLVPIYSARVPM